MNNLTELEFDALRENVAFWAEDAKRKADRVRGLEKELVDARRASADADVEALQERLGMALGREQEGLKREAHSHARLVKAEFARGVAVAHAEATDADYMMLARAVAPAGVGTTDLVKRVLELREVERKAGLEAPESTLTSAERWALPRLPYSKRINQRTPSLAICGGCGGPARMRDAAWSCTRCSRPAPVVGEEPKRGYGPIRGEEPHRFMATPAESTCGRCGGKRWVEVSESGTSLPCPDCGVAWGKTKEVAHALSPKPSPAADVPGSSLVDVVQVEMRRVSHDHYDSLHDCYRVFVVGLRLDHEHLTSAAAAETYAVQIRYVMAHLLRGEYQRGVDEGLRLGEGPF